MLIRGNAAVGPRTGLAVVVVPFGDDCFERSQQERCDFGRYAPRPRRSGTVPILGPCESASASQHLHPGAPSSLTRDEEPLLSHVAQEMVDMLVAENLQTREGVKDALGMELHPSLFPTLMQHLQAIVRHFFEDEKPKPQAPYTHFVEQTLAMLRLFLDRVTEPLDERTKFELTSLLIDFARYTNKLAAMSESQHAAGNIKYWMAQMCEIAARRECSISRPNVSMLLLEYLLSWAADVPLVSRIGSRRFLRSLMPALADVLHDFGRAGSQPCRPRPPCSVPSEHVAASRRSQDHASTRPLPRTRTGQRHHLPTQLQPLSHLLLRHHRLGRGGRGECPFHSRNSVAHLRRSPCRIRRVRTRRERHGMRRTM